MAVTGFHVLFAVGLRNIEKHKHFLGGVYLTSPRRFTVSVTAFSSKQSRMSKLVDHEQPFAKNCWDYLEAGRDFIRPENKSPSRWFSPLQSKAPCDGSPLLLFLPGIDGNGLGLIRQHQKLGQMLDIWCLHIPASNRTAFSDLVGMVETTVNLKVSDHPANPFILLENLSAPA